jgi:hypothetical protein
MLDNEVVDTLSQRLQTRAAQLRGEIRSVDAENAALCLACQERLERGG